MSKIKFNIQIGLMQPRIRDRDGPSLRAGPCVRGGMKGGAFGFPVSESNWHFEKGGRQA